MLKKLAQVNYGNSYVALFLVYLLFFVYISSNSYTHKQLHIVTFNHGVVLAIGTELLYLDNIWVADTGVNSDSGSVLTKDAGARMKTFWKQDENPEID